MKRNQNARMYAGAHSGLKVQMTGVTSLSGANILWTMSKAAGGEVLLSKSSDSSEEIEITGAKEFVIYFVPDDNKDFSGRYYHEVWVTDSEGVTFPALNGNIFVPTLTLKGGEL